MRDIYYIFYNGRNRELGLSVSNNLLNKKLIDNHTNRFLCMIDNDNTKFKIMKSICWCGANYRMEKLIRKLKR